MSLSLREKLISRINKIKRRQSFDDRICDDLCEVILQYLPLEDKLRLECVSKQFQRTVFQKVFEYSIKIFYDLMNGCPDYYYEILREMHIQWIRFETYFNEIESVLKRCPNIHCLYLVSDYFNVFYNICEYNALIELIIKYCNNLTKEPRQELPTSLYCRVVGHLNNIVIYKKSGIS